MACRKRGPLRFAQGHSQRHRCARRCSIQIDDSEEAGEAVLAVQRASSVTVEWTSDLPPAEKLRRQVLVLKQLQQVARSVCTEAEDLLADPALASVVSVKVMTHLGHDISHCLLEYQSTLTRAAAELDRRG
jgi:hypothetical protein